MKLPRKKRGDVGLGIACAVCAWADPAWPQTPAPQAPSTPPPATAAAAPESEQAAPPEAAAPEEFSAEVTVQAPAREVTRHAIERAELERVPGTRGDALRAVEVLPSVARPGLGDPMPVLRGASMNESQTLLEGVPIPLLYHFGNVTSSFNSRLLSRVELFPSNFSARFGDATGGIIDARVRSPKRDRLHALADVSVVDSSALVEAGLGEKTGLALGVRRSNLDFFFDNFVPADTYNVVAAPLYWDYQALLEHEVDARNTLRVLSFGSQDTLELFFAKPSKADPTFSGSVEGLTRFHRLQLALQSRISQALQQKTRLTFGTLDLHQVVGHYSQDIAAEEAFATSEWNFEFAPELQASFGVDSTLRHFTGTYDGPRPVAAEGVPGGDSDGELRERIAFSAEKTVGSVATYAELRYRPFAPLLLVPGVRAQHYQELKASSVDPRLATRLDVSSTTTLKGGAGIYSQAPEFWQAMPPLGNPELKPYHAAHFSVGAEQKLWEHTKLGAEGFYKWIWNRAVGTAGLVPPFFENDGKGRVYGVDTLLESRPSPGTLLMLAYTWSRSERQDHADPWRLFDRDQTHILSLVASRALGKGWEVGARFRVVSGNPETPVLSASYDATRDRFVPRYGAINSTRTPVFHQLDLRVEKQFQLGPVGLAAYLDLQNAYAAEHREGTRYSYDYSRTEPVNGLPILPNLGLRGEL